MRNFSRTLAAAIVATAVAGGAYAFFGSSLVPAVQAHLKDHPALQKTYDLLNDAENHLKAAKDDFQGEKEKALHSINKAKDEVAKAVEAVEKKSATDEPFVPEPFASKDPKLTDAKNSLKEAEDFLDKITKYDLKGHKEECIKYIHEAMASIDRIIAQH